MVTRVTLESLVLESKRTPEKKKHWVKRTDVIISSPIALLLWFTSVGSIHNKLFVRIVLSWVLNCELLRAGFMFNDTV